VHLHEDVVPHRGGTRKLHVDEGSRLIDAEAVLERIGSHPRSWRGLVIGGLGGHVMSVNQRP
jgi:hypothetical protein